MEGDGAAAESKSGSRKKNGAVTNSGKSRSKPKSQISKILKKRTRKEAAGEEPAEAEEMYTPTAPADKVPVDDLEPKKKRPKRTTTKPADDLPLDKTQEKNYAKIVKDDLLKNPEILAYIDSTIQNQMLLTEKDDSKG